MGTDKETRTVNFNDNSGNNPILIRRCTLEDLEGVIEINEKELPEDYPYFFYKSILDNFNESFLIAVDINGNVVGYIMWRVEKVPAIDSLKIINKGHLVSIAVIKGFRRLGISKALLTKSMEEIKKRVIDEFVLEVRVSNYAAINLYKKYNFSSQSIKYKYYRDGENAYFMVCKAK
ncbi:MAG: GNAT family N-acetyltransferase [Candidatus Lokiarchaeota archaeon]|nr:GNAT family N-acetyltransferase [Candidatus Lokiarchaeota archaeon]